MPMFPERQRSEQVPRFPRRHSHFVYGVIQSDLTCAVAGAITSLPFLHEGSFLNHWIASWLISWVTMLPIVLLAAPFIRKIADMLTGSESTA
jgi:hypothetical protein